MRAHGNAQISASAPRALGICQRCGAMYNLDQLQWQFDWRFGPRLVNLRIKVCRTCLDVPQESGRTVVLPPDPVSIAYPLPENYVAADNPLSTLGYNIANNFYPQPRQSLGGNIGNMTLNAGVNAAFDSATNKRAEYSAALSVSNSGFQNTVGKNWNADPSGTSLTITSTVAVQTHYVSSFTLYAPNDRKFLNSATGITGFHLDGSTDNSTWTTLYSGTTAGTVGETITATTTSATLYQYHRIAIEGDGISAVAIAQATLNVDGALTASSVAPVTPTEWTDVTPSAPPHFWFDIAMSSDGTNLVAADDDAGVGGGGSLWTSTDSGASWTERTVAGTHGWVAVGMSSDGSFIAACWVDSGVSEGVAYSSDSGATWNTNTVAGAVNPKYIAVSGAGTKIVVADAGTGAGGAIYLSTDSGGTFAASAGAGSHEWYGVAMSRDGTTIVAVGNGFVMVSTNTGASWNNRTPTASLWDGVAVSSDGSIIGVAKDTGLFYSTNSGVAFTELPATTAFDVYQIAMSDDGATILVAGDASENLMASDDSGVTWTTQDPPGIIDTWNGIALSADGSIGVAVTDQTIWTGLLDI